MFHLSDTCTIQRYEATTDAYGNDTRTPADWARYVPCLVVTDKDLFMDNLTGQPMTATAYRVLVAADQDVIAGDRLTDIVNRGGSSVAGNFEVTGVIPRNGQMTRLVELTVNKVA